MIRATIYEAPTMCREVHTAPYGLKTTQEARHSYYAPSTDLIAEPTKAQRGSVSRLQPPAISVWALSLSRVAPETGCTGTLACWAMPGAALRPSTTERENPAPLWPASPILGSVVQAWVPDEGRVGKPHGSWVNPTAPSFSSYSLPPPPLGKEVFTRQRPQTWGLQAEEFLPRQTFLPHSPAP